MRCAYVLHAFAPHHAPNWQESGSIEGHVEQLAGQLAEAKGTHPWEWLHSPASGAPQAVCGVQVQTKGTMKLRKHESEDSIL